VSGLAFCLFGCARDAADPRVMQAKMVSDFFQSVAAAGVRCSDGLVSIGAQVKWTPCPGQFCPKFKLPWLLPKQRLGAAAAEPKRSMILAPPPSADR